MKSVLLLLTGLALFLGGLKIMTLGLEKLGSGSFVSILGRCTQNRLSAFLTGITFTALTQSSSLTTVIVVGMVEARLFTLQTAVAVIIGANVGTTVTGQMLSFRLHEMSLPIALLGLLCLAFMPRRLKSAGRGLLGLGVLLVGLNTMGGALSPLAQTGWFAKILGLAGIKPLYGVFAGAAATALVQSSSAVMGMVLALAHTGKLTLAAGASLVVGADVGTCVTSILAGLGAGKEARRAALAHLLFNVLSVMLVLPFFGTFIAVAYHTADSLPRQLANAHTVYNLAGALVLLVLLGPYVRLVEVLTGAENKRKKRTLDFIGEIIARWF